MLLSELPVLGRVQTAAAPVTQEWEEILLPQKKMVQAHSQSGEKLPLHLRSRTLLLVSSGGKKKKTNQPPTPHPQKNPTNPKGNFKTLKS